MTVTEGHTTPLTVYRILPAFEDDLRTVLVHSWQLIWWRTHGDLADLPCQVEAEWQRLRNSARSTTPAAASGHLYSADASPETFAIAPGGGRFDEAMKMDIDDIRDMVDGLKGNGGLQAVLKENGWSINYYH